MALETYGKENLIKRFFNGLKNMWDKTIFSDMIKRKKEDQQFRREMQEEARKEAMVRARTELKEQYVQEELDKMKGKKKDSKLKKLAEEFDISKIGGKDDKVSKILGDGKEVLGNDKISDMMSIEHRKEEIGKKKQKVNKDQEKDIDFENKIKKMLE